MSYLFISLIFLSHHPLSLDDKLFSFWHLQGDTYPYSHVKGIFRFETGVKVNEFRDLRANPRCLVESQILSFRAKWSRMIATGVLGARKSPATAGSATPPPLLRSNTNNVGGPPPAPLPASLGLAFDPYDHSPLPARILSTGAAANFPSVSNLVGDIFNAPVYVPATQVDSAQVVPHRNAPAQGFPGRASLGAAYVARWVWGRDGGSQGNASAPGWSEARKGLLGFEEETRRLFGKRWVMSGGVWGRTNVGGAVPNGSVIGGLGQAQVGSGANSGASTPFGASGRSALGNTVFVEEDEDDLEELERQAGVGVGIIGRGVYSPVVGSFPDGGRIRTQTGSTNDTLGSTTSTGLLPSTAYTTPDLGLLSLGGGLSTMNGNTLSSGLLSAVPASATTPTTPTPLTPVVALPTGDSEAQLGLAKVAEPDVDAFLAYASLVPEFCRLEGMVIKNIV